MIFVLSLHPHSKQKRIARAFSSAGSEHLPYKQRVGGSNPSTPTKEFYRELLFFCSSLSFYFVNLANSIKCCKFAV